MRIGITGGSGFIGSHVAKKFLQQKHDVIIFEKTPKIQAKRLDNIIDKINYVEIDLHNIDAVKQEIKNLDVIAHFAASADIALGKTQTDQDLKMGIIVTYNILESMRINNIKKIIFPSSSTIYGNFSKIPTPEDSGMLFPTSLYGAAKLSSEALISAFCHLFEMKSWIFRLGNVVGSDMTRGVINDLINKLIKNPNSLEILGDGNQEKDFIYIDDLLDGIVFTMKNSNDVVNVFNFGTGMTTSVNKISELIINEMNLKNVKINYTGGKSGWSGDAPVVHYDISKIRNLGWSPKYSSTESVLLAIKGTLKRLNFYND